MQKFIKFFLDRQVILALAIIAAGWLLFEIRSTILIFFIAYIFMAGLFPFIATLERWRVPRFLAIAIPYLVGAALIIIFITIYVPQIALQSGTFFTEFPPLVNKISGFLTIAGR